MVNLQASSANAAFASNTASNIRIAPQALLKSFNTWAFKREQPTSPEALLASATAAINLNQQLPFVLYWGKGPRSRIAQPDVQCLEFLASMAARIAEAYPPGAQIELLFTDTHARLNGHEAGAIDSYFADVAEEAVRLGFSHRRLSDVVTTASRKMPSSTIPPSEMILEQLVATSSKWYRGRGTPRDGAMAYYALNMIERDAVEQAYPGSVFITFNNSKMRELFPSTMPIFYMYSLRKGVAVKPWFIMPDPAPLRVDIGGAQGNILRTDH